MDKSLFYSTMCSLLDAGLPPVRALRGVMPSPFRRVASRMAEAIEQGASLTEAMRCQRCFSPMEISIVHAGECSGSVPDSCRQLEAYFSERKIFRAKLLSGFVYPLFLYHFAGLIFTILQYVGQGANPLFFLVKWTVAPWVALLVWKMLLPFVNSMPISLLLSPVPFLGNFHFQIEIARFLTCFGRSQEAGLGMRESILLSSQVCRSALYRSRFRKIAQKVDATNCPFTECAVNALPREWPAEILAMLQTGEATGSMPLYAERAAKYLRDRIQAKMTLLARAIPIVFYLIVIANIAIRILGFYSGYVGMLNELME